MKESNVRASFVLEKILSICTVASPKMKISVVKMDESDNMILDCAVHCGVDYIISGDNHLLDLKSYRGMEILSPNEFLLRYLDSR